MAMRVFISPKFRGTDNGDGGIRRVVEAQHRWLPHYGIELVDLPEMADLIAVHAGNWVQTDKPVVAHCHGLYWAEYDWPKWCHDMNLHVIDSMRKADAVTAPSKWVAYALQRGMNLKPSVLYHGIEPEDWSPDENQGYVLWNKTRVDPVCNTEPLNKLASMAPDVKFVSTFGLPAHNVRMTDRLGFEDAKVHVRHAAVYLATTRETFGIGTLEAMACGVPVLGWAWGGQAEFIEQGVHGWLARPGDYEGLLEGLRYCLAHRDELGVAARSLVLKEFTWERAMERNAQVYRNTLAGLAKSSPKVSVIVTCYNLGHYLSEVVSSLAPRLQGMDDYEVVLVDDASTDDSGKVCDDIAADIDYVRVVHNESNLYLAGALNEGLKSARGKYLIPVDADNMLAPNTLKVLSDALDQDRDIDIAYGAMEVIEQDGRRFVSGWPTQFDFRRQMLHQNQCPSTSMYRRAVFDRSGGYRRRCRTAEDADFWCRVTSLGFRPKKVTDAVTLIYRNRHDSMSHVQSDWDWTAWYAWSRKLELTPFGVTNVTPQSVVPSYEPAQVAVVIPVGLGHENLVVDAIDCLQAQAFTRWELIVVNDTGKQLPWVPPYASVLDTGGRQGPAVARNLGIEAAKAPLIVLLDADDYLQPNALQLMCDAWLEHKGYVYTDWMEQETRTMHEAPEYDCEEILRHLPHSITIMFAKSAWAKVGGFDTALEAWEDWDFVIALNAAGYCGIRVPEPLLQYRYRSGQRREQLYARKDELKQELFTKWASYISGGKKLMACGGCAKRSVPKAPPIPAAKPTLPSVSGEMVLLEYVSKKAGTATFVGKASGRSYRFGTDPGHRVRYVLAGDAQHLLARADFKMTKIAEPIPVLEAAGPPAK